MYGGDCQVMGMGGGNVVVNSEAVLFSSQQNTTNFNFIPTMPFQPFPPPPRSMVSNSDTHIYN